MSVELGWITEGLLCQFYGFTLSEARGLEKMERDVYVRYMEMTRRLRERELEKAKKDSGYG